MCFSNWNKLRSLFITVHKLKFVMIREEVALFRFKKLKLTFGETGFRGAPDSAVCTDRGSKGAKSEVA